MTICGYVRRAWGRTVRLIESLFVGFLGAAVAHNFYQQPLKPTLVAGLTSFVGFLVFNLARSPWLDDKPRGLSDRAKRKITEYLRQYSPQLLEIHTVDTHDEKAAEGMNALSRSIQSAIASADWGADLAGTDSKTHEPRRYSEGVWICGKGAFVGTPSPADILQDAFRRVRLKVKVDKLRPWPGINIVVGFREDKCLLQKDVRRLFTLSKV